MRKIDNKTIETNGKTIKFGISINDMAEFDKLFIIMLRENKEVPNNIIAYDYDGNQLWKINDIVKAKKPTGFYVIEKMSATVLRAWNCLCITYFIDVEKREIIKKIFDRQ